MNKLKVLVVEDAVDVQQAFRMSLEDKLNGKVDYLSAFDHQQALCIFQENPDLKLIVLDGSLASHSRRVDTGDLAREFRKSFSGPMLAASGDQDSCRQLILLGCDYSVEGKKHIVPNMVISIFQKMGYL